jgi:hypothetical protein
MRKPERSATAFFVTQSEFTSALTTMLSGLLCRQARLGLSLRLTAYLSRPSQKHVLALAARQTQIHSQRAFSISRALFQEAEATPEPKVADLTQEERYNKVRWSARILFLANLPYDITEAEIRELFAPYGEIGRILLSMFRLILSIFYPSLSP